MNIFETVPVDRMSSLLAKLNNAIDNKEICIELKQNVKIALLQLYEMAQSDSATSIKSEHTDNVQEQGIVDLTTTSDSPASVALSNIFDTVLSQESEEELQDKLDKINDRTVKISSEITKDYLQYINDTIGNNVLINEDVYFGNLPDHITPEIISDLNKYNQDYKAGVLLNAANMALDVLNNNPNLDCFKTSAPYPIDGSVLTTTVTKKYDDFNGNCNSVVFEQLVVPPLIVETPLKEVTAYLDKLYLIELSK